MPVFPPLSVIPLFDQLHHVAALHRDLRGVFLLVVGRHRVFTGTLREGWDRGGETEKDAY